MKIERFDRLGQEFTRKHILVVGDMMLDNYLWGEADRISSEAPVPVVRIQSSSSTPGGAANVANNLVSLGAQVSLCGVVGEDNDGAVLRNILNELQIDSQGVIIDPGRTTTVKTRIIAQNQQVVRTDWEDMGYINENVESRILDFVRRNALNFDAVILEDYNKGLLSQSLIEGILKIGNDRSLKIYVDPKTDHFFRYNGVEMIKPNINETGIALKKDIVNEEQFLECGKTIRSRLHCNLVLITRGELGMTIFDTDGYHNIPTKARQVHDVSGAGDTVIAAYCLGHISGLTAVESAIIANYAAGRVCEEVGVVPITIEKLREIILHHNF